MVHTKHARIGKLPRLGLITCLAHAIQRKLTNGFEMRLADTSIAKAKQRPGIYLADSHFVSVP